MALVVSIDFDGCLGGKAFIERYQALLKKHSAPNNIPPGEYEQAIVEGNQVLFDKIKEMSKGYDKLIIMVGSNRTSAEKDQDDGPKNHNGSAYRAVEHFSNALQRNMPIPVEVNKRIVFDSVLGQKPGYNFDLKTKQTLDESLRGEYLMSGDMKFRLAYFQIHDVCAQNPDYEVTYVHADDRDDIVDVSANTYGSKENNKVIGAMLPANLKTARFLHYEEYNPIAHLLRVQRILESNIQQKLPMNDSYIETTKKQIQFAIDTIMSDMKSLVSLCEGQELDQKTQMEVGKANTIIERLSLLENQLDQVNGIDALHSYVDKLNSVMKSNVRHNDLKLPHDISERYETDRKQIYQQRVIEFGSFERSESSSYTVPQDQYDALTKKCFSDQFPQSSIPLSILKQITTESRQMTYDQSPTRVKFDQLVDQLKDSLVLESAVLGKKNDKWSNMIINKHQQITKEDSDKERAIKNLSNSIFTARGCLVRGEIDYEMAVSTLNVAVENAIKASETTQKQGLFGKIGITHSTIAKQLSTFKQETLDPKEMSKKTVDYKSKVKEMSLPTTDETRDDNTLH